MADEHAERHARERQAEYDIARGATFNDARVRFEYPAALVDRLASVHTRIARMCRERKPPAMSIPAKAYDDDMFIMAAVEDAMHALNAAAMVILATTTRELRQKFLETGTPDSLPDDLRAAITQAHTFACWWKAGNLHNPVTPQGKETLASVERNLQRLGHWLDGKPAPAPRAEVPGFDPAVDMPADRAAVAWEDFSAQADRGPAGNGGDHG